MTWPIIIQAHDCEDNCTKDMAEGCTSNDPVEQY